MQILNATKSVKSIFADNGEMITIKPGEVSRLIIASKNIVTSAMSLGSPKEIGIIANGSYDREVAKDITGSIPYLYTDLDEAKSKLIDPNIDYKSNANAKLINIRNEQEIADLKAELENAKKTIDNQRLNINDLNEKLSSANHDSIAKYNELDANFLKVQKERDNYKSQLQESQDQVSSLTKDKNDLNKQLGSMQIDLTAATKSNTDLNTQLTELTAQVDTLTKAKKDLEDKIKDLELKNQNSAVNSDALNKKDEEIATLKASLDEATTKIKSMADEFNAACEKFNIGKDENGEWVQGN